VRLDHLLSKERWPGPSLGSVQGHAQAGDGFPVRGGRGCLGWCSWVERWLVRPPAAWSASSTAVVLLWGVGVWSGVGWVGVVVGALLGPEGTGPRRLPGVCCRVAVGGCCLWCRGRSGSQTAAWPAVGWRGVRAGGVGVGWWPVGG
jgi:hypothetical protein